MQAAAAVKEAPADGLTLGARAGLELQMQDAQRDLRDLITEHNDLLSRADVHRALACEPGQAMVANNSRAASLRLSAFTKSMEISALRLKVANLESQLKSAPAQVAPVVLTLQAGRDMEDTMNFQGAPA